MKHSCRLGPRASSTLKSITARPFDVLLSADSSTPSELAAEKKAVAASQITYAQGQLLLWSAQPGYVDGAGAMLKTGTWKHLALATPKLARYGAAGQEVLQQLGVDATGRTVLGENMRRLTSLSPRGMRSWALWRPPR